MRGFLKNMAVLLVSALVALAAAEGISRLVWPIQYGHKSFDAAGQAVYPGTEDGVAPGMVYRQQTQEFDIPTTHTARGFRGPAGGFMDAPNPHTLFVGDSMTYGIGLTDDQTIPYLYCQAKKITCANLGRPGSGMAMAARILERRIVREGWRPQHVNVVMNVMTSAQFGGNDITDDLQEETTAAPAAAAPENNGEKDLSAPRFRAITRADILEHSNLARVGYYIFAPVLRGVFNRDFDRDTLTQSLAATRKHLLRIDDLARRYNFDYTVYIVHPMQDLMRGTWATTYDDIARIAPGRVIDTAPALLDSRDPVAYYYPLDGHVRPEGAEKIADFMVKND